jgi:uncharacterized protein (DUF1015 family)
LGFIALLELQDGVERQVYRHEATLAAPKEDRARLLDAVPANLSPIFGVYPDEQGTIQKLLMQCSVNSASPPIAQGMLHGERIWLWAVTQPRGIEPIVEHLKHVGLLIADGHHRFEVAYSRRRQYGMLMAYFVSMKDPALIVRPIHRVVHQPVPMERLRQWCAVEPAGDAASLTSLVQWLGLREASEQGYFAYWDGRQLYRVSVRPDRLAQWLIAPSVPRPIAALEVSLLHQLLLPQLYDPTTPALHYTADASSAVQTVNGVTNASAWLLRAIPLPQVYALAAQGLTLPPKSTYFYPKVPSGLVLNPLASDPAAARAGVR